MKEKYYVGDPGLRPHKCYKLSVGASRFDLDFAIPDLDRGNIRWAIWSEENGEGRMEFVLYRDRKGLVLKKE